MKLVLLCSRLRYASVLLLLAGVFAALPLPAQQGAQRVSAGFRVYLWDDPASGVAEGRRESRQAATGDYVPPAVSFLDADGSPKPIEIAARRLSRPYHYSGPNPLVFVQEGANAAVANAEPIYNELGNVILPENASDSVLFFFPDVASARGRYAIVPVSVARNDLPVGMALVVSLSDVPVATRVGGEQFLLGPWQRKRIPLSGIEGGLLPVMLGVQNEEGNWQLNYSHVVVLEKESAPIIVIYAEGDAHRVQIVETNR